MIDSYTRFTLIKFPSVSEHDKCLCFSQACTVNEFLKCIFVQNAHPVLDSQF